MMAGATPRSVRLDDLADGGANVPSGPLVVVDLDGTDWSDRSLGQAAQRLARDPQVLGTRPILIGITHDELPPSCGPIVEQLTLTLGPGPSPWCAGSVQDLAAIAATVTASPHAARVLAAILEVNDDVPSDRGLHTESLAYSMLLAGPEFVPWRRSRPRQPISAVPHPVVLDRRGDHLSITLNRPARHNAWGHQLRDAFLEALAVAEWDHDVTAVTVSGNGPSFCSGGDLDEFGTTPDPVTAHLTRLERSGARAVDRLAQRLGANLTFELHGACIGAGIEIPAFAPRVRARYDTRFRLPELSMGLIPGAGGTVSIPRRIGRWRTAWLAFTGRDLDAATARNWGLVDELW